MLKKIFLLLIVFIVLSIQHLHRGWLVLGNQLVSLIEEPQLMHLWREIVQGRNGMVVLYIGVVLLLSKIFVIEVQKYNLERKESLVKF
jgi:hypothetical protein